MAKVGGSVKHTFRSKADAAATRALFVNLDKISAATTEATHIDRLGADTLKITLAEQNHGVTKFTGQYTVRYAVEGDDVVWRTLEGNMLNEGRARITARPDGSADVHWDQRIEIELPIPGLLARVVSPIATKLAESSIHSYVTRMLATVG